MKSFRKLKTTIDQGRIEAEQGLIGALIRSTDSIDQVNAIVDESDFYDKRHGLLFTVINDLVSAGLPVDVISIEERCQTYGNDATETAKYSLILLRVIAFNQTPPTMWAKMVKDRAVQDRIRVLAGKLHELAKNPNSAELRMINIEHAEAVLFNLPNSSGKFMSIDGDLPYVTDCAGFEDARIIMHDDQSTDVVFLGEIGWHGKLGNFLLSLDEHYGDSPLGKDQKRLASEVIMELAAAPSIRLTMTADTYAVAKQGENNANNNSANTKIRHTSINP